MGWRSAGKQEPGQMPGVHFIKMSVCVGGVLFCFSLGHLKVVAEVM